MKLYKILPLLIIGSVSANEVIITESSLLNLVKKSNPSLNEIEATFLDSKAQAEELKDKFGYEFYTGYNHIDTKEKPLITFQPVFSTVNQYSVGVKKYTKYGVVLDVNRSVDVRSAKQNYRELTTTTDQFGIQVDLWKDFMGRMTKAQFDNVQDLKKKDEFQKEISKSMLGVNIRKLYWTLVANHEKIRITKNLYNAAKKQAADARRRKANSVSDKAEVARFESLVHQRKGSLLFLEYEREELLKSLKDAFPTLNGKELKIGEFNINKTIFEVLSCTGQIENQKSVPYEYTDYDEITSLLRTIQTRQGKVDETYDDIDLKFDLAVQRVGVASETDNGSDFYGDYETSLEDFNDNDRNGFTAGLMLTIPFGEDKKSTKAVKDLLTEKQFSAQIEKLDANVTSTHVQVKNSVKILANVIKEQKANSKQLQIRVGEMKKKYRQARIPEYVLIQDEDSLLQSDLSVVDTQLRVVSTVLDYFSVFNNFPCSFNRK